jgi:hypothetical protein
MKYLDGAGKKSSSLDSGSRNPVSSGHSGAGGLISLGEYIYYFLLFAMVLQGFHIS